MQSKNYYFSSGWTGSACSVNVCPHFSSCSSCTSTSGCGWCETQQRCMSGTGNGPEDSDQQCPAWFFHHCVTMALDNIANPFSIEIYFLDCKETCNDESVQDRGNSVEVPGSERWCSRWTRACTNFEKCFNVTRGGQCTKDGQSETCVVPSEDKCPGGVSPIASDTEIPDYDYVYLEPNKGI